MVVAVACVAVVDAVADDENVVSAVSVVVVVFDVVLGGVNIVCVCVVYVAVVVVGGVAVVVFVVGVVILSLPFMVFVLSSWLWCMRGGC